MGGSVVQLAESIISSVMRDERDVVVKFSPAFVIRSEGVPGVDASTRWTQGVTLRFGNGETEGEVPELPAAIVAGRIAINNVSYLDMIPMPLESAGRITLELELVGDGVKLALTGETVKLELLDDAKYIEHIAPA